MPFPIERYVTSLAALESLDSSLTLLTIADEKIAQRFRGLESATRRAEALMREFGPEFTRLLDMPRSDRPELAITETDEWMKTLERLTAAAQQSSDRCRAALAQALSNIQSLDLPSVLYLDQVTVEQSLSTIQTFVQETRFLSPASLTGIEQQIASGLTEHARTHVSRLLDGARDEALAILSELDARLSGFQLVQQVAAAAKAVNIDVRASYEKLQFQIKQVLESGEFIAIVQPDVDEVIPGLQGVDVSKVREVDIDAASSGMLHIVCTSITQRLNELQTASDLRSLIPTTPRDLEITVESPRTFAKVQVALQSLVALVDVFARAVAALMRESGQAAEALLTRNYFIGKDAYALKRKLREQEEAVRNAQQRWPGLYAAAPAERVKALLSGISDISSLIGIVRHNAAIIADESVRLRASSPVYDIASVIELQDGSPVGLRSLVQNTSNRWVFAAVTAETAHDTNRTICISFPAGIVTEREFKIELAPESILGDWVRWISGGFMRRARPSAGPKWPRPSSSLRNFLRIHVFRQWAGNTRLQDLIAQANLAARHRPQECETYFSKVES